MALIDQVDLYTQALNTSFLNGYEAVAEAPPVMQAVTEVPSSGKIENYPWLYPPPLMRQWKGYRRYAKLGSTNYRVPNLTYSAEFEVLFEDFDDDQVGGYKRQAAFLGQGAKEFPGIQCLQNLALGQTLKCFDDSSFFATSHTVGTGNNIVSGTAAGADGVTHAMAVLVVANSMVKPLLWQQREGPAFNTDAGSIDSEKSRMVKHWATLRGAAAFGFWWDAVLVKFANTPTVAEMQTTLGTVNARLRGFKLPSNQAAEPAQYVHGQRQFSDKTVVIVCSSLIDHVLRQALTLSLISNSENFYKGFATQVTSGYMDNVT